MRHTWACFLRGINVGGHQRVAMADLRQAYRDVGCDPVLTYIQSGNVVVGSPEHDAGSLRLALQAALVERCGVDAPVMARAAADWRDLVDANPFPEVDVGHVHVTLLEASPGSEVADRLAAEARGGERVVLQDRQAYWCLPDGVTAARKLLAAGDRLLGTGTMRTWRTALKVLDMVDEVEAAVSR